MRTAVSPRLLWAAAVWAFLYGTYRAYYALGGTFGMFGTPVSQDAWVFINSAAAVLLFGAAAIPVASRPLWARPGWRTALLALAWLIAVGCVMHAVISTITRILSLAGLIVIDYPFFETIDRTAADLQDLLFNEPWFLVEGVVWAGIGFSALGSPVARQRWVVSIGAAVAVLTVIGMLSTLGLIGRFVVG